MFDLGCNGIGRSKNGAGRSTNAACTRPGGQRLARSWPGSAYNQGRTTRRRAAKTNRSAQQHNGRRLRSAHLFAGPGLALLLLAAPLKRLHHALAAGVRRAGSPAALHRIGLAIPRLD
jgi:hypothetical protein